MRRCCFIETRDQILLNKIIMYCDRISDNIARNKNSYSSFETDMMFQDACCMCIIQIGELVGQLSDEIRNQNPSVPWRTIKDTRNFYVHAYGSIDVASVWETLQQDIPLLKESCKKILNS